MCAQKNDDALEFLRILYDRNNKLWADYRTKRVMIEKAYLETNFDRHRVLVEKEFELLSMIYETIKKFEKYIMKKELVNKIKMVDSLSVGQKKYLSLLLRMYDLEPRFFTTLEITQQNKITKERRSTIQRLFTPSEQISSKWKRGNIIIKEFLETKFEMRGGKKRITYKPVGVLATFSEIFHYCKNLFTYIDENTGVFLTNYNSLRGVVKDSKQITNNERSLIKQTIIEYEKKLRKRIPNEKQFIDRVALVYHGKEELLQDQFFALEERLKYRDKLHRYCERVKNTVTEV